MIISLVAARIKVKKSRADQAVKSQFPTRAAKADAGFCQGKECKQ